MSTSIEISEIRVYVGTYHKYNCGSIDGEWLDLSDYSDINEFYEACKELHSDEEDPEYMFQDYEAPEFFISNNLIWEGGISDKIYEVIEALEDADYDFEVYEAYANNCGFDGDIEKLISDTEEAYQGEYQNDEEFAEELADQLGLIPENNSWPNSYIDWERAARDLMMDYFEYSGHYFRNI